MKQIMQIVVGATFALACLVGYCQDAAVDATAAADAAQVVDRDGTPEFAAFAKQMLDYKEALKKLRGLKESYQTATPEEKDKIVAEFTPLVQETKTRQDALVPLALKAYVSVDGQNTQVRAFLCSMLHWLTETRENYEVAYEIAKVIFDYPLPEKSEQL